MGQGTEETIKHQISRFRFEKIIETVAAACSVLWDSHANRLRLFWDLPECEEQADLLSLVQEQGLRSGLGFQESLQRLYGLFHLTETLATEL